MTITKVQVIEELPVTDFELVHPLDRDGDKHSTTIVNRSHGFNHGTFDSRDGLSDHIQEGFVSNRSVGTGKGLTNDLLIIGTGKDLEWNLHPLCSLKTYLLDIPFGKPVVLEIKDFIDLS